MSILFTLIVIVASAVHLFIRRKNLTRSSALDILSLYAFAIFVGLSGFFAGLGHIFNGPEVAIQIGWSAGSPFQTEVGICNIAFGVLGFLCLRFKGGFREATAIGWAIFLIGAGALHLQEVIQSGNLAPYNLGMIAPDIIIPLYLLALVFLSHQHRDNQNVV
jgi:hypothetical protein